MNTKQLLLTELECTFLREVLQASAGVSVLESLRLPLLERVAALAESVWVPKEFERVLLLSPKQYEIFRALGDGLKGTEICDVVGLISIKTVEAHFQAINERLGFSSLVATRRLAARFLMFCELNRIERVPVPELEVVGFRWAVKEADVAAA